MTIDEGDSRDLVPRDSSKEAAAATGVDVLRQQKQVRPITAAARAPAIDFDQAGVVPLESDEVERDIATEAVGRRNPSGTDNLSVRPRKGRQAGASRNCIARSWCTPESLELSLASLPGRPGPVAAC